MSFLDVPGARLHTQELGSGPRTVVLVHGLFANIALWYFSLAPVLARTRRVVLYDMRGHGLSTRTETGYSLRSMTGDLAAVIDSASDEEVSLVGFSFGAAVAIRYAVDHPDRVDSLVAVEPPLPMDLPSLEAWVRGLDSRAELIEGLPEPQRVAARGKSRSSKLVRGVMQLVNDTSLQSDIEAEPDIPDEDLKALTARTLVCYGLDSPIAESGIRARLEAHLPRAVHTAIPGGHFLPTDNAEELNSLIAGFLNATEPD
jgi:pimeloyl-ACP methyl ester carboxylesterase